MNDVIVHPRTGEVLDLNTVGADALLEARDLIIDRERELREFRRPVDDELIRRADHEGRRSLTFSEYTVSVTPPLEKVWDTNRLENVLDDLVGRAVISQAKADKCLKIRSEPVWLELKTLLSDPRVRNQIQSCFTEEETRRYVRVTRRG